MRNYDVIKIHNFKFLKKLGKKYYWVLCNGTDDFFKWVLLGDAIKEIEIVSCRNAIFLKNIDGDIELVDS